MAHRTAAAGRHRQGRAAILLLGAAIALCADDRLILWVFTNVPPSGTVTTAAFWMINFVVPVLALRAAVLGGGAWGGLRRAGGRPGDWLAATLAVLVGGGMLIIWLALAWYFALVLGAHAGGGGFSGLFAPAPRAVHIADARESLRHRVFARRSDAGCGHKPERDPSAAGERRSVLRTLKGHGALIDSVMFSPDGQMLATLK